jgi:Flp pilus assembly protein TadB
MTGLGVAIAVGVLLAAGLWALGGYFVPVHPRLGDALRVLDGRVQSAGPAASGFDRLGAWARVRLPGADDRVSRQLQLRGISINRFYTYKVSGALVGLFLPWLVGVLLLLTTGVSLLVPAILGLVLAVVGFFVPDIVIGRGGAATSADATEALLTFVDLVTLERLANSSATQSLHAAAAVSDQAVFVAIRDSLQRSRLEQRAPFAELKRLGDDLDLPALCDIADVMKLDDSGASLSDALRARVKELRDAHLTEAKIEAATVSERMTVLMVMPSLIFGLLFLIPPLLRMVSG